MGTIKVHEFTTLDGVIGAPMWTMDYPFTEQMIGAVGPLTASSSAILLGRTTYEMFGPAWSSRTVEDDPGAPFFNETHKYVVSSTLEKGDWEPATILGGYDADMIREFKDGIDGGIYISGSGTLVRALIADGLVDELHLFVYPVAVGEGPRLFPEGGPQTTMALIGAEGLDNGVVHLTYGPAKG
ncbi:dihydrofolate reductase family protein [Pseudonocardia humida]|uniref:Dihydrofolate reductase family protein n=1 Tax=Pseudonocardia humida TaxID=2800819 RepID=A0ABT0ZUU7_9PSEU|nr:dihydrofolate reductase family protein [Pseudonocardia humida]MCO1654506.1 dihydrofolate reductase family protein [Pseudonocardia humida]